MSYEACMSAHALTRLRIYDQVAPPPLEALKDAVSAQQRVGLLHATIETFYELVTTVTPRSHSVKFSKCCSLCKRPIHNVARCRHYAFILQHTVPYNTHVWWVS